MNDAGLMRGRQPLSGLRQQARADSGGGGERWPIRRRQARKPFLFRRGPAGEVKHLERVCQVDVVQHRLLEALAEFVGLERVIHVGFGKVAQDRFGAAARIEDAVDRFVRGVAQPIDDADGAERQAIDVARLDQRELIERDDAAGEQNLPERASLPARLDQQGGECVGVDELCFTQHLAEL